MPLLTQFSINYPGVQVLEGTYGAFSSVNSNFNDCLMFLVGDATATEGVVTVTDYDSALEALAGTNTSYVIPNYYRTALETWFSNSFLDLRLVVVNGGTGIILKAQELAETKDYGLSILVCPHAEITANASGRKDIYEALIALAEATHSVAFVTLRGDSTAAIIDDKETLALAAPQGHALAFTNPTLKDSENRLIDSATAAAAATLRRIYNEGIGVPGAGVKAFVRGVGSGVAFTDTELGDLTEENINAITLKQDTWCVWGFRSLSTLPAYTAGTVRFIFNVLGKDLENTAQQFVFESIDGQGELFTNIRRAMTNVCDLRYSQGVLFGKTPKEAYAVVCDNRNNTPTTLENLEVRVDVYAKPSPFAEKVLVGVFRTSLDTNLVESVG